MAVAIREAGYHHIKIYNGGIKDWRKKGLALVSIEPLPEANIRFISSSDLKKKIELAPLNCVDGENQPVLTLLDFRNEMILNPQAPAISIKTHCKTINILLDDLLKKEIIGLLPRNGLIVTVTETGNRDDLAIRYLSKFGFNNIQALKFGMRDWIKNRYPVK